MPDIRDGLSQGQDIQGGGDLAAQAAKGIHAGPREEREPVAPEHDSAEDIARAMLSNDGAADRSVRSGITLAEAPEPAVHHEPLSPENAALVRQAEIQLASERDELQAGRAALQELAIKNADLDYVGDSDHAAVQLADLKGKLSPERYDEILIGVARDLSGVDEDETDDDELEYFAGVMDALDQTADRIRAQWHVSESERTAQALIGPAATQQVEQLARTVNTWKADLRLSPAEARQRLAAAEAASPELIGVELHTITDPKALDAALRSVDSALVDQARIDKARAVQEAVAGAESTSIRDGIEVLSPFGTFVRPSRIDLGAAYGPAVVDPERVSRRAISRPTTGEDVRRAVAAPESTDWRAGLTNADGKQLDPDVASGGLERHRRQLEDDRARSMGLWR